MLESSGYKFFKKKLQHKCFSVKFVELLRITTLRNICKRLLLEVFYEKAVLENFAIFIGQKKLVINCSVKKLFLVRKWRVFILKKISCKKRVAGWTSCSFLYQVFYLCFSKTMTLNRSSFAYYSWKSLFLQNILKYAGG